MVAYGILRDRLTEYGVERANVDFTGIGQGMCDRADELGDERITGIRIGEPSSDPETYVNLRAEAWWQLRERFQPDENGHAEIDIDPEDDELAAQLGKVKRKPRSDGRIQIESKEEMRRRGMPSPDDADAVVLSFVTRDDGPIAMTFGR